MTSQALGNNEEGSNTPASLNPECRSLKSVPTLFPYFKIAAQPSFTFASCSETCVRHKVERLRSGPSQLRKVGVSKPFIHRHLIRCVSRFERYASKCSVLKERHSSHWTMGSVQLRLWQIRMAIRGRRPSCTLCPGHLSTLTSNCRPPQSAKKFTIPSKISKNLDVSSQPLPN